MNPRVGIILLNWNGGAQTIACVESIRAQAYPHRFIVLVDNNSAVAEREQLRRRYGDDSAIDLCWLDENRGYAGGNNAGIAAALERGADLLLIVTQDATLAPGALATLVAAATAESAAGIIGLKVVDAGQPWRVLSVGERLHVPLLCMPRTLLRYRKTREHPYEVSGVVGCVMLLTRSCLETIGGFDEELFAYYEEVDVCLRARARGFKILCTQQAVATHDGMRGFLSGFTGISAELKARNLLRVILRWATPFDWFLLAPTYALLLSSSVALYTLRGRLDIVRALLRGVAAGLRGYRGATRQIAAVGARATGHHKPSQLV